MAELVWSRLGPVDNYIEPFFGSGAVLLRRPDPPKIETVNDLDCMVANFWRATQRDPEQVAAWADGPVNEADLHSRHRWLVLSDDAAAFRARMRSDPEFFDPKIAGWWCWGLCCWIGGGWCTSNNDAEGGDGRAFSRGENQVPAKSNSLRGVCSPNPKRPTLSGSSPGSVNNGKGVHAAGPQSVRAKNLDRRRPRIDGGDGSYGHGVHKKGPSARMPTLQECRTGGKGVNGVGPSEGRPQLGDAFDIGRGVNGNGRAHTCAERRAWLIDWFGQLRDRFRLARVCCGHWLRVCDSDSVTVRLGRVGIFFDPPYGAAAGRDMSLYACESGTVAADVRAYCLDRGADPRYRIALAGYEGEGHEALEKAGWECVAWKAQGGYGNRSKKGKANAKRERLWFSPHCLGGAGDGPSLFDFLTEGKR